MLSPVICANSGPNKYRVFAPLSGMRLMPPISASRVTHESRLASIRQAAPLLAQRRGVNSIERKILQQSHALDHEAALRETEVHVLPVVQLLLLQAGVLALRVGHVVSIVRRVGNLRQPVLILIMMNPLVLLFLRSRFFFVNLLRLVTSSSAPRISGAPPTAWSPG